MLKPVDTFPFPSYFSSPLFLSSPSQWINRLRTQSEDLSVLRHTAYLNLVCVRCGEVNQLLAERASDLADRLVTFLIDRNRDLNKE